MQYISKGQWGAILICATLITAFHNKWNKLVHNFTIKIHMLTTNKSQSLEWQHGQHFKFGPLKHALISHINTTAFLLHMITTRAVHPTWRSPWAKKNDFSILQRCSQRSCSWPNHWGHMTRKKCSTHIPEVVGPIQFSDFDLNPWGPLVDVHTRPRNTRTKHGLLTDLTQIERKKLTKMS